MKQKRDRQLKIYVYADWLELKTPQMMGVLSSNLVRGKELFAFEYNETWLQSKYSQILDPQLQLFSGVQYNTSDLKNNFGLFLDSSPDRWGRLLQKRRAAIQARISKQPEPHLFESDFLLGVYDTHRLGGLRFSLQIDGIFLNDDSNFSTPPMTSLKELEAAAWAIENDITLKNSEEQKWIRMLIAPGGSLGGARPKASVLDDQGQLWIAKFPSRNDEYDSGAWESIIHNLAQKAGIKVPEAQLRNYGGNSQHTFLSKRFDRKKDQRIHFASAMTLLDKTDGANSSDGSSYLELAEFIMKEGAQADQDLEQLWKRIVFSICVSNTDDHLRNHGFLLTSKGWILSPAYDINADPDGDGLKLNISENDNSQNFELALEVAKFFRLQPTHAKKILEKIIRVVSTWKTEAQKIKISRREIEKMANAFRLVKE